jgi:hypothetical protein
MIDVKEREDGSFDISWDENDPVESILNTWTEQDFIDCIMKECKKILNNDSEKTTSN